jgi:hypothetical protein
MQTHLIPLSICDEADKLCRNFIWGSTDEKRKCHLISWDTICSPKDSGGLGFRKLRDVNLVSMMKLGWRIITNPDSLWARVLWQKYKCNADYNPYVREIHNASPTWRGICKAWPHMISNVKWNIGDGRATKFWTAKWVTNNLNLEGMSYREISQDMKDLPVANYSLNDNWNWNLMDQHLSPATLSLIASHPVPHPSKGKDYPSWALTSNGQFSFKSAYDFLLDYEEDNDPHNIFNVVWDWEGPQKIRNFLWKVSHGRLLTNVERKKRHMSDSEDCEYCHETAETVMHVLRDCPLAHSVWSSFVLQDSLAAFFSLGTHGWMRENIRGSIKTQESSWSLLFGVIAWQLWNARNDRIFKSYTPNPQDIIRRSVDYAMLSRSCNSFSQRILRSSSKSETLIT